jgi:hypothetical protein
MLKYLIRGHSKWECLESLLITADANFQALPPRVLKGLDEFLNPFLIFRFIISTTFFYFSFPHSHSSAFGSLYKL